MCEFDFLSIQQIRVFSPDSLYVNLIILFIIFLLICFPVEELYKKKIAMKLIYGNLCVVFNWSRTDSLVPYLILINKKSIFLIILIAYINSYM